MGEIFLPAYAAGELADGHGGRAVPAPRACDLDRRKRRVTPAGAIAGTVQELTFFGSLTRIKLGLGPGGEGEIWADLPSDSAGRFALGMPVWASWSAGIAARSGAR